MNPALELLVQFVGAVCNPFVVGVSLLVPFFWPRPAAVRLGPTLMAGAFGLVDAVIGGALAWGALLIAVSAAGGAAVGQAALLIYVPLLAATMSAARAALTRLRGG